MLQSFSSRDVLSLQRFLGNGVPGNAVPGGRGVLALHAVASPPPPEPGGAGDGLVLAQLIQTGLPGHVEPHGLLVVDVDALSGGHVSLGEREPSMIL